MPYLRQSRDKQIVIRCSKNVPNMINCGRWFIKIGDQTQVISSAYFASSQDVPLPHRFLQINNGPPTSLGATNRCCPACIDKRCQSSTLCRCGKTHQVRALSTEVCAHALNANALPKKTSPQRFSYAYLLHCRPLASLYRMSVIATRSIRSTIPFPTKFGCSDTKPLIHSTCSDTARLGPDQGT